MSNRRFEIYHYRQVIHRMRMDQSDRAIASRAMEGRSGNRALYNWPPFFVKGTYAHVAASQIECSRDIASCHDPRDRMQIPLWGSRIEGFLSAVLAGGCVSIVHDFPYVPP